ncbi:MAG: aminotransferase class V-fold PLP-dependent enzyme [Proteobacteria bacterium]|nr:aminotransferase class V-fold PLP-dependent enzyme [Pseudomonadota bacterium]NIS68948.1 aminotransferase class V-fold PLP-dependent enzyme [Pseudomonadota bacterium]
MQIPEKGIPKEKLFQMLEAFRSKDLDWRSGHVFGYVYDPGPEVREVGHRAYSMFLTENGLDFTVFPSLLRLENELVAMAAQHLGGDDDVVGNFTSGGTESIILAVKAARDYFRAHRPNIREPEMILPATAHAAFHKAAHYLQIKVAQVGVDPKTFRADAALVGKAITPNTILLVGSAPSYAHGVVDPIRELGQLAMKHNLLLHVDACVGGFMLPYYRRLGVTLPDFDFTVPGVTSISMDLHKYAYTPKGASLVLYRDKKLRKFQIFASSRWTGYTLINNAVQSSKSGGPMAAAWAVLNFIGDDGYLEFARRKLEATRRIVEGIQAIEDLRVMTRPDMCLLAFTSDTVNVFHIIDEMNSHGWYVQPALTFENSKENIHLSINVSNVEWVDAFLTDLEASVEKAKTLKSSELAAAIREGSFSIDLSELGTENFMEILQMVGIQVTELPKRMAGVNEALSALPPEIREGLLIEFVNELFRYRRNDIS